MYDAPRPPRVTINDDGEAVREVDASSKRTTLITDEVRVYKGGSWKDRAYWLDPAQRRYLPQYIATDYIGFRCAMSRLGSKSKVKKDSPPQKTRITKLKSILTLRCFFFSMNTASLYTIFLNSKGVSTDSRTLEKKSFFLH